VGGILGITLLSKGFLKANVFARVFWIDKLIEKSILKNFLFETSKHTLQSSSGISFSSLSKFWARIRFLILLTLFIYFEIE
jgi:hypothetical protein